jgi:hypothetical protein
LVVPNQLRFKVNKSLVEIPQEVEPMDDQFPAGDPSILAESLKMPIDNGAQSQA